MLDAISSCTPCASHVNGQVEIEKRMRFVDSAQGRSSRVATLRPLTYNKSSTAHKTPKIPCTRRPSFASNIRCSVPSKIVADIAQDLIAL